MASSINRPESRMVCRHRGQRQFPVAEAGRRKRISSADLRSIACRDDALVTLRSPVCLAIMFCCEACVVDIASPNTPSRLTIPTVRITIEIRLQSAKSFLRLLPRPKLPLPPVVDHTHPGFADY